MSKKTGYILDTDPWYDPDDLFSILLFNTFNRKLDLIVTGDEVAGKRAALTNWFLEKCGRQDIPVVAGCELPLDTHIFCEDLIVTGNYKAPNNTVEAIRKVVEENDEVVYMGIQALTNIAKFAQAYPDLQSKIKLYQMGGVLNLEGFEVEHNIKIDVPSAKCVLESDIDTHLVLLDTTLNPTYRIDFEHSLYKKLKQSKRPEFQALARNCELFHEATVKYFTYMHDPLTVSAALGENFVDFYEARIKVEENGKLIVADDGKKMLVSRPKSRAKEFMELLEYKIFGGK